MRYILLSLPLPCGIKRALRLLEKGVPFMPHLTTRICLVALISSLVHVPQVVAQTPPGHERDGCGANIAGIVLSSVGIAGGAAGIGMAVEGFSQRDSVCTNLGCPPNTFEEDRFERGATGLAVGGIVLGVIGALSIGLLAPLIASYVNNCTVSEASPILVRFESGLLVADAIDRQQLRTLGFSEPFIADAITDWEGDLVELNIVLQEFATVYRTQLQRFTELSAGDQQEFIRSAVTWLEEHLLGRVSPNTQQVLTRVARQMSERAARSSRHIPPPNPFSFGRGVEGSVTGSGISIRF